MTVKQRLNVYWRKKRYRDSHKDEIAAKKHRYREQNREQIADYASRYNAERTLYRLPDGTTQLLTQSQIYKVNNRDSVRKQESEYYQRITKNKRAIYRQLLKLSGLK